MVDLKKELQNLPKNFVIGVVMPSENYESTSIDLLRYFINVKNVKGNYVSINRPYSSLIEELSSKGIKTDNLTFIDCITKELGGKVQKVKNCSFIESPSDLTSLGIALHQYFISSGEKNRILYFDSISSMCIHNSTEQVLRFIHYLTGKMRVFGLNGLMLTLHEDTDKKLIAELSQFCDKIIRL